MAFCAVGSLKGGQGECDGVKLSDNLLLSPNCKTGILLSSYQRGIGNVRQGALDDSRFDEGASHSAQGRASASGLAGGNKAGVEEVTDGVLLRRAPLFESRQLSDVFAMLKTDGRRLTVDEMDFAVLEEARRRHAGD